jgi:hypothetical protein
MAGPAAAWPDVALEVAAARAVVVSVSALLDRLEQRLLAVGGGRM